MADHIFPLFLPACFTISITFFFVVLPFTVSFLSFLMSRSYQLSQSNAQLSFPRVTHFKFLFRPMHKHFTLDYLAHSWLLSLLLTKSELQFIDSRKLLEKMTLPSSTFSKAITKRLGVKGLWAAQSWWAWLKLALLPTSLCIAKKLLDYIP